MNQPKSSPRTVFRRFINPTPYYHLLVRIKYCLLCLELGQFWAVYKILIILILALLDSDTSEFITANRILSDPEIMPRVKNSQMRSASAVQANYFLMQNDSSSNFNFH
jgi:hypothetical protein